METAWALNGAGLSIHDGDIQKGIAQVCWPRMLFSQLLEYVGRGGIAAFGLFLGRQAQFDEQRLSQLLGGIEIEFIAYQIVNIPLKGVNLFLQGFSKPRDARGQRLIT